MHILFIAISIRTFEIYVQTIVNHQLSTLRSYSFKFIKPSHNHDIIKTIVLFVSRYLGKVSIKEDGSAAKLLLSALWQTLAPFKMLT